MNWHDDKPKIEIVHENKWTIHVEIPKIQLWFIDNGVVFSVQKEQISAIIEALSPYAAKT